MDGHYVAALDVGTTTVRCHIFDQAANTVGVFSQQVSLLYPDVGRVEIDPEQLWEAIVNVIKGAIKVAGIGPAQVRCLGVSTQRNSFITWHRETGAPFHNFITWKDVRADSLVRQWNDSFTMKSLRMGARLLYTVSRSKRFLAGSVLKLMNTQVTLRLVWALQNVGALREASRRGLALFGCVDSWLVWRLTGGASHVTDVSNASSSGFFDPFTMQWAGWALTLFKIPASMLPTVVDTAGVDFGCTASHLFGDTSIPIRCVMADQAASTFGSCCFKEGDLKVTLGTGTFLNVNTGTRPHASIAGLYPLVGWRVGDEISYLVEGASNDTGSLINWAMSVGWLNNPAESEHLAASVKDSGGVFFIPAFSGLQAPVNDPKAAAGVLGVTPTTERAQLVRALLESVVFRVLQLYQTCRHETHYTYSHICIDGGVSQNNFVAQLIADLTGVEVERCETSELSVLGAGFFAGLSAGVWESKEDLCRLRKLKDVCHPRADVKKDYEKTVERWTQAVERFLSWYPS